MESKPNNPHNFNLHKAKVSKQDEFYTRYSDIENELKHYTKHFKDKTVYCNCDNPYESNFVKYFTDNFETLGLKKLIATNYNGTTLANTQTYIMPLEDKKKAYVMEMTSDNKQINELKGNGDFRSKECIDYLKTADIVVTNPPFSLLREYIAQLMRYAKQFLILCPLNAIAYKEIFPLIKNNRIWFGYNSSSMVFDKPDGSEQKLGMIIWMTNTEHNKHHQKLELHEKYSPEKYRKFDNYNIININKVSEIPNDYDGIMGVPITFLLHYCPEQFEIIDDSRYYNSIFCNVINIIDGKQIFRRILIRRVSADGN